MQRILGLDIGGAHIKAACVEGRIGNPAYETVARTHAFPLWKQPERLTAELRRLYAEMPAHDLIAVTMTGELCDCFATKREGVRAILRSVRESTAQPICVWCTKHPFLDWSEALDDAHISSVAAANWLALAHFVARQFPREHVLLIDTGSTTTDILYLHQGVPEPSGLTDIERLASGELVYTGIRRTPMCAVLGMQSPIAAEWFATLLVVYIWGGLLPPNPADC